MAIYRKGADPDALDASADRLDSYAGACRNARSSVDEVVGSLQGSWGGGDAERLTSHWRRTSPTFDHLDSALTGLGRRLRDNARSQRGASGAGGSGFGGGSMPFGPPSGPPTQPGDDGVGGPVDGYDFGPPSKPDIEWDEGFEYDSKDAGWRDHLSKAEWMAKLHGGRLARSDLDDATAMYGHYWDNNGEHIEFDYEEGVREDPAIARNVDVEIARTAAAVDEMVRNGNTDFSISGDPHPSSTYPETENWQKTIGGYQQWSSADVTVANGMVTMEVTVHAEDYYNFNPEQSDIATGAGDDENGRFTEIGWAKPFPSSGEVTRTVTWPVGEPPPEGVFEGGEESRNPGREDRVDERGNPRPGIVPDNDRDTGRARVP